jgi:hypothetical protein
VLEILPIVVEVAAINKFHIIHIFPLNIPLLDLLLKHHSNITIRDMEIFHREANLNFKSLNHLFTIKETIPRVDTSNQLCIIRPISSNLSIIKSGPLLIIHLLSNNSNLIGRN